MAAGENSTNSCDSNDIGVDMDTGHNRSQSSSSRRAWDRRPTEAERAKFRREKELKEGEQEKARIKGAQERKRYDDDIMDNSTSSHPSKSNGT